jgi:hypothetical protein
VQPEGLGKLIKIIHLIGDCKEMFKFVKRWDKCMKANGDCVDK